MGWGCTAGLGRAAAWAALAREVGFQAPLAAQQQWGLALLLLLLLRVWAVRQRIARPLLLQQWRQ